MVIKRNARWYRLADERRSRKQRRRQREQHDVCDLRATGTVASCVCTYYRKYSKAECLLSEDGVPDAAFTTFLCGK